MSQTQTYQVRGMTCGHCAGAVTSELQALDTVTGVTVDVVPQGDSTVTVTSSAALDAGAVRDAIARRLRTGRHTRRLTLARHR